VFLDATRPDPDLARRTAVHVERPGDRRRQPPESRASLVPGANLRSASGRLRQSRGRRARGRRQSGHPGESGR
jgi:hypothetical protein